MANGVFCKKGGKWGVFFFVKSRPFLNAECIVYSISIFLFYILQIWGAYAPNAPPLPTGQRPTAAAVDRYRLSAGPTAANPPHAPAAVDRRDRQTDGRTP